MGSLTQVHPLRAANPDVGCGWLCETAGQRTRDEELLLVEVLEELPHQGRAFPLSQMPMDPGLVFKRVN